MEIKICGITNMEDAVNACKYGVDAVGFIFYSKSPRYVTPITVKNIIKNLPHDTLKVGVFVNQDIQIVKDIYEFCDLDLIQLHGDETPEYCMQLPDSILIKAFSPQSEEDLNIIKEFSLKAIVIDSRDYGLYGGTGKISNWELAAKLKESYPLILSGGLNPDNILDAIEIVLPHAVDVNSGVEDSPRKKNQNKMKHIIELVHNIKRKSSSLIFTKEW